MLNRDPRQTSGTSVEFDMLEVDLVCTMKTKKVIYISPEYSRRTDSSSESRGYLHFKLEK